MAKKQKIIHIDILGDDLYIYSDLIWWEIDKIEGVVSVEKSGEKGYLIAYIDMRYDIQEIKREIIAMAKARVNTTPGDYENNNDNGDN